MDLLSLPYVITFGAYVASAGFLGADNILGSVFLTLLLGAVAGCRTQRYLDILYVTSMAKPVLGVPQIEAEAGAVFAVRGLGVKGLPEPRFAGWMFSPNICRSGYF
jgi:hypothetical protein